MALAETETNDRTQTGDNGREALLAEIEAAGGRDLVLRLDEWLGAEAARVQDEAAATVLGGVAVEGCIIVPDGRRWGPEIRMPIPIVQRLNPSFDECRCCVAEDARRYGREKDGRLIHDMILEINAEPFWAITSLLVCIDDDARFNEPGGLLGSTCFETFFDQHNWTDPVAGHDLAQQLELLRQMKVNSSRVAS